MLTQQALYAERRLSMGQIRYLALLGKLAVATLPQHTERSHCSIRSMVEYYKTSAADCSVPWASSSVGSQVCHLHYHLMIRHFRMRSCSRFW